MKPSSHAHQWCANPFPERQASRSRWALLPQQLLTTSMLLFGMLTSLLAVDAKPWSYVESQVTPGNGVYSSLEDISVTNKDWRSGSSITILATPGKQAVFTPPVTCQGTFDCRVEAATIVPEFADFPINNADTVNGSAVADLGNGMRLDMLYSTATGKRMLAFPSDKTIKYALYAYNCYSGSLESFLVCFNNGGLKWGSYSAVGLNEAAVDYVLGQWLKLTPPQLEAILNGSSKGKVFSSAITVLNYRQGQAVYCESQGVTLLNGVTYASTKTPVSKIQATDCNGKFYRTNNFDLTFNSISIKYFELETCFVAGTKVKTQKGLVDIETIRQGDQVWSFDPKTSRTGFKRVISLKRSPVVEQQLVEVTLNSEKILATEAHPFYVASGSWRWIAASRLEIGQKVCNGSGGTATVLAKRFLKRTCMVYNLEVEDWATYTVGSLGAVVHNDCTIDQWQEVGSKISIEVLRPAGIGATFESLGGGKFRLLEIKGGAGFGASAPLCPAAICQIPELTAGGNFKGGFALRFDRGAAMSVTAWWDLKAQITAAFQGGLNFRTYLGGGSPSTNDNTLGAYGTVFGANHYLITHSKHLPNGSFFESGTALKIDLQNVGFDAKTCTWSFKFNSLGKYNF